MWPHSIDFFRMIKRKHSSYSCSLIHLIHIGSRCINETNGFKIPSHKYSSVVSIHSHFLGVCSKEKKEAGKKNAAINRKIPIIRNYISYFQFPHARTSYTLLHLGFQLFYIGHTIFSPAMERRKYFPKQ